LVQHTASTPRVDGTSAFWLQLLGRSVGATDARQDRAIAA